MVEKLWAEIWPWLKSFVTTKWRSFWALILLLSGIICAYFLEAPKYFTGFNPFESYNYLAFSLILSAALWVFIKYKNKLVQRDRIKFGIIINTENRNVESIERILKPIIRELSQQIRGIKFIELDPNEFHTAEGAYAYLKKNDHGLKQVLQIRADIGKENGKDKFLIKEAGFHACDIPIRFRVHDVTVDLRQEIPMRSSKNWSFAMDDDLKGMTDIRLQLKDIVYYYLGLSSVCDGNPELGLSILKRLFNPDDHLGQGEMVNGENRIRVNRKFFLSSRLLQIITRLCQALFDYYHRTGKDASLTIAFLKEYADLLDGSPNAVYLYIPLARYYYDSGDSESAKVYTRKAAAVDPNLTAVMLNTAFFAILDNDAQVVVRCYRTITKQIEAQCKQFGKFNSYEPLDVIAFLHREEIRYPQSKPLFDYAIAISTLLLVDADSGQKLIDDLLTRINTNAQYKPLEAHLNELLKKLPKMQKVSTIKVEKHKPFRGNISKAA